MQITATIDIVCAKCGRDMPVDMDVGREPARNRYIYRVMPCQCCDDDQGSEPYKNQTEEL